MLQRLTQVHGQKFSLPPQITADLLEACKAQVQIPCTTIHMMIGLA